MGKAGSGLKQLWPGAANEAEILSPAALDKGAEEVAVLPGSLLPAFIHLGVPAGKSRAASGFLNSKLPNLPCSDIIVLVGLRKP